ncbi:hypothetical protein A6V39_03200 [Candidatus Mycoplasma haematobovis]|uniref:Type I restriction modification DNA specificity domain-containing protein n=1 Tax=Candidatus Mycoplasma haematobovis TaxID=432608 RepID=A0A1A9QEP0_9MOLU|nr:restriction endonuclease subunit S [Candidatus Mycoplasma haematobovis]OAL10416.1 hypothetical protein A6V39_03200 [Candidatus Mycoplasma haematobovis]
MVTWKQTTLDKLGRIQRGRQTHKPEYDPVLFENGTIPFIQMKHVTESLYVKMLLYYNELGLKQSKLFPKDTVLITNDGRVGDSSILKESSCISTHTYGFNAFENISDTKFVKYCFNFSSIKGELKRIASSGGHPILTVERLLKILFPNPPFELQQKIGKILSTYDLLIENYQNQIDLLKNQRTKEPRYFKDDSFIINFLTI